MVTVSSMERQFSPLCLCASVRKKGQVTAFAAITAVITVHGFRAMPGNLYRDTKVAVVIRSDSWKLHESSPSQA